MLGHSPHGLWVTSHFTLTKLRKLTEADGVGGVWGLGGREGRVFLLHQCILNYGAHTDTLVELGFPLAVDGGI